MFYEEKYIDIVESKWTPYTNKCVRKSRGTQKFKKLNNLKTH